MSNPPETPPGVFHRRSTPNRIRYVAGRLDSIWTNTRWLRLLMRRDWVDLISLSIVLNEIADDIEAERS